MLNIIITIVLSTILIIAITTIYANYINKGEWLIWLIKEKLLIYGKFKLIMDMDMNVIQQKQLIKMLNNKQKLIEKM